MRKKDYTSYISNNEYFWEMKLRFEVGDRLDIVAGVDGNKIIEYKNSCGCLLNRYNINTGEIEYF